MSYFYEFFETHRWIGIITGSFWLWMIIDAGRKGDWFWAMWMFFFAPLSIVYFFLNARASNSTSQGFELPGAASRHRIAELQRLIHDLDKPHHYLALGDIYFRKGKLAKAEKAYRESLQRDPNDREARAHLGQCMLRLKRAEEAKPLLYQVCNEDPKHDYGYSLMAYAETLAELRDIENAIAVYRLVLEQHGYARARVQLGQLLLTKGQRDEANALFREVINDDRHAPRFQRRRDWVWVWRSRRLLL